MSENQVNFEIGDLVEVKKGINNPDKDADFGGWSISGCQGKIIDIKEEEDGSALICVRWNEETLKEIPDFLIKWCEEKDLDYKQMYLSAWELTSVKRGDQDET